MKLTPDGGHVKRWAKLACPCGCGAFTYLTYVEDQIFATRIPAGVSRTTQATALQMFRKEIAAQVAILKQIAKGRAMYDITQSSSKTIH